MEVSLRFLSELCMCQCGPSPVPRDDDEKKTLHSPITANIIRYCSVIAIPSITNVDTQI